MKLTLNHQNERGFIPVIIIGVILFGLIALFIYGTNEDPKTFNKANISVDQLKNDVIDTTDPDLSIPITTNKPEDTYTYKVAAYANGNQLTVIQRDPMGKPNTYDIIPGSYMRNGVNDLKIEVRVDLIGDDDPLVATKQFKLNLIATKAPVIKIKDAAFVNDIWQVNDYKTGTFKLSVDTAPDDSKNSSASSLNLDDTPIQSGSKRGAFEYEIKSIKDGGNTFIITAKNDFGETITTLAINKLSKAEQDANATYANTLIEAQAACAQYAEINLTVKDVNVSYDQSSIRKRNPDGTFLVKANIADSNGLLGKQKSLGIMECTTDSTGTRVVNFTHY